MVAIIYILNLLGPINTIVGVLGLVGLMRGELDESLWIFSLICGIFGIFFGIKAWSYDTPPRWFWSKSQVDLFENKVGCAFGYMIQFALMPFAIAFIIDKI